MVSKKNDIQISTLLGSKAVIEGGFTAEGSVRIDGVVNGNVTVTENLIIGATGIITGDIAAKAIVIGGEVIGDVEAPEKAELTATAKVLGDITTNVIVIDENAVFQGKCNMNQAVPDKKRKSKALRAGKKTAKAAIVEALKEVEEASRDTDIHGAEQVVEDISL